MEQEQHTNPLELRARLPSALSSNQIATERIPPTEASTASTRSTASWEWRRRTAVSIASEEGLLR